MRRLLVVPLRSQRAALLVSFSSLSLPLRLLLLSIFSFFILSGQLFFLVGLAPGFCPTIVYYFSPLIVPLGRLFLDIYPSFLFWQFFFFFGFFFFFLFSLF